MAERVSALPAGPARYCPAMKRHQITVLAAALVACAVATALVVTGCGPVPRTAPTPSSAATGQIGDPANPPRLVSDPGHLTGSLTGPCTYRDGGQLPDPRCTPGSYDPKVTAAMLCAPGYTTRTYRLPESQSSAFKYNEAYPAYQVPGNVKTELDHLISLELGGSNDASNLWPEDPPTPNPKDTVENQLHAWVCAATGADAETRLAQARLAIATDWQTAERVLGITGGGL